jgi:hypothetical protein
MLSMAEVLVSSGMLPKHIQKPAAAVAIIQKGKELGVPPMHALSNIFVVEGKPTCSAELMLALVYRDHGDAAIQIMETDNQHCLIAYTRRGWQERATYAFTMQDAAQAGVANKATWKQYPAAMLRARCISAVARMAFPDSIAGMYVPEELGAEVDEDGAPVIEPAPIREIRPASVPVEQSVRATVLNTPRRPGKATAGEIQGLWATATRMGVAKDAVRDLLAAMFPDAKGIDGSPSTRELTSAQVAQLIATIEETQHTDDEDEPVDEYADIATATDQGVLLSTVKD